MRSPSQAFRLPSVISLKEYVPAARRPAFTRFNVFLRDRFECQYCGEGSPAPELTFDHVIPRSRGGRTTWTNVVTACSCCNLVKGSRLPNEAKMFPRNKPVQPTSTELQENGRAFPPNYLHESCATFLLLRTPSSTRSDQGFGAANRSVRFPPSHVCDSPLVPRSFSSVAASVSSGLPAR